MFLQKPHDHFGQLFLQKTSEKYPKFIKQVVNHCTAKLNQFPLPMLMWFAYTLTNYLGILI